LRRGLFSFVDFVRRQDISSHYAQTSKHHFRSS
jgi:hypothetical protein